MSAQTFKIKDTHWIATIKPFEQWPVCWVSGTYTAITELAAD
jgi:hypothetical protein